MPNTTDNFNIPFLDGTELVRDYPQFSEDLADAVDAGLVAAGTIKQVVNEQTGTSVSNSSSTFVDSGLTATITPSSATSKILVFVTNNGIFKRASDTQIRIQLLRGGTVLKLYERLAGNTASNANNGVGSVCFYELDAPNTTSAVTYKTQFHSQSNTAEVRCQANGSISSIVLMEVAG